MQFWIHNARGYAGVVRRGARMGNEVHTRETEVRKEKHLVCIREQMCHEVGQASLAHQRFERDGM